MDDDDHKKGLDFNAPLLSARRFSSVPSPCSVRTTRGGGNIADRSNSAVIAAGEKPRRATLPFYRSELKSGPVRKPGVVPFVWEQIPGRPKDDGSGGPSDRPPATPKLPPGRRIPKLSDERKEEDSSPKEEKATPPPPIPSSSSRETAVNSSAEVQPKRAAEQPISEELRSGSGDDERDEEEDDDDAFSDAASCFMNCSVIGGIDAGAGAGAGSFSTDPQVRDFMMGRFLPAAQAMATASPQRTSRKPPPLLPERRVEDGAEHRRRPLTLLYQHRPSYLSRYGQNNNGVDGGESDEEDDDDCCDDTGNSSVKGCGFLPSFCLKSSFGLLNPIPGLKVNGRLPPPLPLPQARRLSPQVRASPHRSLCEGEDENTWEAVYKHKLGRTYQLQGEDGSKLTSESNQLTYSWSDSQTPSGSSPYRRSTGGGVSPYRNDMPPSPFHEGKGFLGVPKSGAKCSVGDELETSSKESGHYWEITPHLSTKQGPGSLSPAAEKTVYVDSVHVPEILNSKLRSGDTKGTMDSSRDGSSEVAVDGQKMEVLLLPDVWDDGILPQKVSNSVGTDVGLSGNGSDLVEQMDNKKCSRQNGGFDCLLPLPKEDQGKNDTDCLQSLLSPPLPKSPSESWLWRTLPTVSTRKVTPQSFLGIQFHPRKQAVQTSSAGPKWEMIVKTSNMNNGQTQFSEVLAKPANKD